MNLWTFYINAVADINTYTVAGDVNVIADLKFGTRNWSSVSTFYNGVLDDIRIYNRVLTSEEIITLYNE